MLRSFIAGTYTGAILGVGTAVFAGAVFGTGALPFVVGSSIGFAAGSIQWYRTATQGALFDLARYPSLMRLHLIANFPYREEFIHRKLEWYTPRQFHDWALRSMLVVAWMSAQPALDEVKSRTEADVVAGYGVDDFMGDKPQ